MKALLLFPRDPSFTRVADAAQRSVRAAGIQPQLLDDLLLPGDLIAARAIEAVNEADVVIADVSRRNPNVLFELGVAYANGKPIIVLLSTDAEAGMPFDVAEFQLVVYDPDDLRAFTERLSRHLQYVRHTAGVHR